MSIKVALVWGELISPYQPTARGPFFCFPQLHFSSVSRQGSIIHSGIMPGLSPDDSIWKKRKREDEASLGRP